MWTYLLLTIVNQFKIRIYARYILQTFGKYNTTTIISKNAKSFINKSSLLQINANDVVNMRKFMNKQMEKNSEKSYIENIEIAYDLNIHGIQVLEVVPFNYSSDRDNKCSIFLHGGGYVFGDVNYCHSVSAPIIFYSGLKTYMINYSKAPENPFPAGLNDCVEIYRYLVDEMGYEPKNISVFGASAGASLCASMLFELKRLGYKLPRKMALLSPWADIDKIGDSYYTLEGYDPIISYDLNLKICKDMYLFGENLSEDIMKNPLVSPVYGDYSELFNKNEEHEEYEMEILITTGTRDLFLSNSARLYRQMKNGGMNVTLDVKEGMWHVYQIYGIPEGDESASEVGRFLNISL